MLRLGMILWICAGALGLGIVVLEAKRRGIALRGGWYPAAIILGPVFLCFILPLWLGRWGKRGRS